MTLEEVVAQVLNEPAANMTNDTSPNTVNGWDSMRHLELVMAVETRFGIQFDMAEIVTINSLGSFRNLLHKKGIAT